MIELEIWGPARMLAAYGRSPFPCAAHISALSCLYCLSLALLLDSCPSVSHATWSVRLDHSQLVWVKASFLLLGRGCSGQPGADPATVSTYSLPSFLCALLPFLKMLCTHVCDELGDPQVHVCSRILFTARIVNWDLLLRGRTGMTGMTEIHR